MGDESGKPAGPVYWECPSGGTHLWISIGNHRRQCSKCGETR